MVQALKSVFLVGAACFVITKQLAAHEYILLTNTYKPKTGDSLSLRLFVADGFNIEAERPFENRMAAAFTFYNQRGIIDVRDLAREKSIPFFSTPVNFNGLGLFRLDRDYAYISLEPAKFRAYLKEDHIENITLPASATQPQRERYSRYIKCLVQSKPQPLDTTYKTITGQELEIILLQNPYSLKPGQTLQVQLLYQGKPLAGKMLTARQRTDSQPATTQAAR
ncbi:MAG TPA: DUF4198 domain-containing protein, partial [Phnomibacter sp.]|nr:DUF4198 domain-containing protein [Phnomibacter sp.]